MTLGEFIAKILNATFQGQYTEDVEEVGIVRLAGGIEYIPAQVNLEELNLKDVN